MININKTNHVFDLLKEGYEFDKKLTEAWFGMPNVHFGIVDEKLCIESINYLTENIVKNNNIKIAIGWQDEGMNKITHGIFLKDISKENIFNDVFKDIPVIMQRVYEQNICNKNLDDSSTVTYISTPDKNVSYCNFKEITFKDVYGEDCSLQYISSDTEPRLLLGVNEKLMYLNQEHVKMLLPNLQNFVETGKLKKEITVLTGETKYFKITNPSRPTKWVDFNNEEFVFTEENNNSLEFIISDKVDASKYYIISDYLTNKLWEINKIGRVGYGRNFIFSYNAMMYLINVLKLNSEYFVEYKSSNVKKFVDDI